MTEPTTEKLAAHGAVDAASLEIMRALNGLHRAIAHGRESVEQATKAGLTTDDIVHTLGRVWDDLTHTKEQVAERKRVARAIVRGEDIEVHAKPAAGKKPAARKKTTA